MKSIVLFVIICIFIAAFISQKLKDTTHSTKQQHISYKTLKLNKAKDELSKIHTTQYTKQYIIDVINNGSKILNFKGGIMEGGFASKEDAPKIACYVMTLSHKKCQDEDISNAPMFYSSICAGCHGNDGKGLNGSYPDLTKPTLLGIQKREEELKRILKITSEN